MTGLSCPNLYHVLLKSHSEMCVIEITLQMKGSDSIFLAAKQLDIINFQRELGISGNRCDRDFSKSTLCK